MANSFMVNVPEEMSPERLAKELAEVYGQRGFSVNVTKIHNSMVLTFDKGCGGINMVLGMGVGIRATMTVKDGVLTVNYSDGDWIGKIIAFAVFFFFGWTLIGMVPLVTGIIGTVNQSGITGKINNDITTLVG